jgi:manganese-dependent inorganic pyrophosphatase
MNRISKLMLFVALTLLWGLGFAADPILVIGHKNPDTDAITAAMAVAHLKTQMGVPAIAVAQGLPNPETKFVLETFTLSAPPVQMSVAGRQVFLVDHSDYPQAPDDLRQAEIVGLVDHHKLGGLMTDKPIEAIVRPVGCSATIITGMYADAGIAIPKPIAGAMLSAILSDTVIFKSPTTTPADRAAAFKLAALAGIEDMNAYGIKMFQAKSEFSGAAKDLLKRDLKTFNMNGKKIAVAQLETVDLGMLSPRKEEFFNAMSELKADGHHSVLLMLTDILKEGTELMVVTDDLALIEAALGVKTQGKSLWVPGMMSRKKQVIPGLEKAFK